MNTITQQKGKVMQITPMYSVNPYHKQVSNTYAKQRSYNVTSNHKEYTNQSLPSFKAAAKKLSIVQGAFLSMLRKVYLNPNRLNKLSDHGKLMTAVLLGDLGITQKLLKNENIDPKFSLFLCHLRLPVFHSYFSQPH